MLVSYNWLKRYIPDINLSNNELKEILTQKTCEVENFKIVRENLSKIVCGQILELSKHPKSDHLNIAKVDILKGKNINEEPLEIVCGAPNLFVGQKVAVCLVGGTVYSAENNEQVVKITAKEVLGITSNGMICSEKELGIGDNHEGIMELSPDTIVGSDLIKNGLEKDVIFEIENKSISHRGDLFSHLGIARELYAILDLNDIKPIEHQHVTTKNSSTNLPLKLKITTKNCKRFSAVVLSGVTIKPSPLWLQAKLQSLGIRPINNIVDITNYIMLDLGQPMHAYDYDKISDHTLIARDSAEGEQIVTLDGIERTLGNSITVISDSSKINGIGGIIGGLNSSITENTTNIVLEAANFERFTIRKSSRSINLRTEASSRFEKGLDPENTVNSISYAMSLVLDLAGGDIASEIVDIYPEPENEKIIEFDVNKVNRLLGIQVNRDEVLKILNKLQIDTTHAAFVKVDGINPVVNTSYINVVIPSFRRDINIQEDLLEEIARMYGYSNIVPTLPLKSISPKSLNNYGKLSRKSKKLLAYNRVSEIYSYSFVSEEIWNKCNLNVSDLMKLTNPLMPEYLYMRNDLIPSLLETLSKHINNYGDQDYQYFELNRVVKNTYDKEGIHEQPWTLALINYSNEISPNIKILTIIDEIIKLCQVNYKIKNFVDIDDRNNIRNLNLFHKSQSGIAYIEDAKEIISIAKFGKLNPRVRDNYKFDRTKDIEIASINMDVLSNYYKETTIYSPVSDRIIGNFDISLNLPMNFESQMILNLIKKINGVISTTYIDRYIKNDINSLTIRIESDKENLTEVKSLIEEKIKELDGVTLR